MQYSTRIQITVQRKALYLVEAKVENSKLACSLFGLKIGNFSEVVVTNHVAFTRRIPEAIDKGIPEMSDMRNKGQCLKVDFTS